MGKLRNPIRNFFDFAQYIVVLPKIDLLDLEMKSTESSEKAPLSGCYEISGVPHLDEANGPKGVNPQLFDTP